MRDLYHNIAVVHARTAAAITATDEGATVDRLGYESVTFAVHIGAWTDGTHVLSAEDSDDGSTWAAVASGFILGTPPTIESDGASPVAGTIENATRLFGYVGNRRYVRPKITVTGSPSTGAVIGIDAILGHPHEAPTS